MNQGRPLEFDPEEAVNAAIELFWRSGYEATSMSHLLEAMNISKSSLYQAFGNKKQLFERCLEQYSNGMASKMADELKNAHSGRHFIEVTFRNIANTAQQPAGTKGCLVANSASEFGQRDTTMAMPIASSLQKFIAIFVSSVTRAQAEGDISTEADPHALATYLLGVMYGLRLMIKAGMDKYSARQMVDFMLKALD